MYKKLSQKMNVKIRRESKWANKKIKLEDFPSACSRMKYFLFQYRYFKTNGSMSFFNK